MNRYEDKDKCRFKQEHMRWLIEKYLKILLLKQRRECVLSNALRMECVLITACSAWDAPAQRAAVQTLHTDHRQAGRCFILARERYMLRTPPWCFEAGAKFGTHRLFAGPVWMEEEALMDRAGEELSSGSGWLCEVDPCQQMHHPIRGRVQTHLSTGKNGF